ncbi:MAG: phosphatidate cytidylyltransferase [Pirellulaceae bacterium]
MHLLAKPAAAPLLGQTVFNQLDTPTMVLLGVVLLMLAGAYGAVLILRRQPETTVNAAVVRTFSYRLRAWWLMTAILVSGLFLGRIATVVLFGLVSFWALREFITMTPTRRGDHRALFWAFFLFTPFQYFLVAVGSELVGADRDGLYGRLGLAGKDFYGFYSIMIPVYASLVIPAQIAISGDHKRFLERAAKIQAGLLICVYSLSYAPALLDMELVQWQDGEMVPWTDPGQKGEENHNAKLLVYFVLLVQIADVMHYIWDRLLGRHVIAPDINASKTWEGLVGSVLTTALFGLVFTWATPFTLAGSAAMSATIAVMGAAGGMTMSAIKRDRGVRDYGTLVQGHAGVLDRIDSLCFAAPVFFHITRFYLHP